MRGHGASTNPSNKFTHRQLAHDIYALLDKLDIKQFKAIGYSSGAMTLLHMATQQPTRPQSIVLMSATHYFPKQDREMKTKVLDKEYDERWMTRANLHERGEEQITQLRHQFYKMKDSYTDMNFTPPYKPEHSS